VLLDKCFTRTKCGRVHEAVKFLGSRQRLVACVFLDCVVLDCVFPKLSSFASVTQEKKVEKH
jgi:hypothetical protein